MSHEPHETREAHEAHEAREAHIYSTLGCVCSIHIIHFKSCSKWSKSFDQDVILSKFWNPDTLANTKSFDQEAIMSNFGDRRVAPNDVLVEGSYVF